MSQTMKERWRNQTRFEKISTFITVPLAIAVVIAAVLLMMNKISSNIGNAIIYPCIFTVTLINGLLTAKQDKKNAIIIFVCAAIILVCGLLVLFL